jgi:hypothetical protein
MLPSMKVTVPVGDVTLTVKVTGWPTVDGLSDDFTVVPLPAWFTICESIGGTH